MSKTGRLSGLLRIRYYDDQEEWLSEESDRIFWQDTANASRAKEAPRIDYSKRSGWKVAFVPPAAQWKDHASQGVSEHDFVKGVCVGSGDEAEEIVWVERVGDSKRIKVPARTCLWLRGALDNTEVSTRLLNTKITVYSGKQACFRNFVVIGFNANTHKHAVKSLDGEGRILTEYCLPMRITRGEDAPCGSNHTEGGGTGGKGGGQGALASLPMGSPVGFFGTEAAPNHETEAVGLRVLYFDLEHNRVLEGAVLGVRDASLYKVLFTNCAVKWLCKNCHDFEFTGESGVFEYDKRCHLPPRMQVLCNGRRGTFLLGRQLVSHEGEVMSPSGFEKRCGLVGFKKWRQSIRVWRDACLVREAHWSVERVVAVSQTQTLGECLAGMNLPSLKGVASPLCRDEKGSKAEKGIASGSGRECPLLGRLLEGGGDDGEGERPSSIFVD